MKGQKIIIAFNIALIVIFFSVMWLPNIDSIFNIAPNLTHSEKRAMAKLPELKLERESIKNFHAKFVKYFIDNFGFRNLLIRWNSLFKLNFLKVERFPRVLIGKNGWLYLLQDDSGLDIMEYYRRVKPFSEAELQDWVRPFEDVRRELARRGIQYILVLPPIKNNIYPENIPSYLRPVRPESRLDQIRDYIRKNTEIDFIDLRDDLWDGKKKIRVFFKHDTHWNLCGGHIAYQRIMQHVRKYYPQVRIRTFDEYSIIVGNFVGGDLASLLGLNEMFSEENYIMRPKFMARARKVPIGYENKSSRYTECYEVNDQSLPRAVVFHDSYFNFVKPFVAENFRRMACFQSYSRLDLSIIEKEKPDIVIHEIVEMYTMKTPVYLNLLNFEK